ncbi:MAG: phenylalanine--tRNA ligase subunit alpha, partial [Bacteroidales bacterium]|nr:phenylalanine--tRNA ligase subunit alpha [Bacteroidales bacterium]
MKEKIQALLEEAETIKLTTAEAIERYRIRLLGKKGELNDLFEAFKQLEPSLKKEMGAALNRLKTAAQAAVDQAKAAVEQQGGAAKETPDMTRPVETDLGHRHPLSLMREEIIDIFGKIGFVVWDGPEIEDDWHLFSARNFPP